MRTATKKKKRSNHWSAQEKRMDKKFSVLIRLKYNLTCIRCGTQYLIENDKIPNSIHCMHRYTRTKRSTRWSYENCFCGCYGCHSYLDRNDSEWNNFLIQSGLHTEQSLLLLKHKSEQVFKGDRTFIEMWIEQELQKILPNYQKLNYSFLNKLYANENRNT